MKHLTKMKPLVISLMVLTIICHSTVQVRAYTADTSMTGYPFPLDDTYFHFSYKDLDDKACAELIPLVKGEENSYYGLNSTAYSNVDVFHFGWENKSFVFPYMPDLYDYYLVGTLGFVSDDVSFDISAVQMGMLHNDGSLTYELLSDLKVFNFNSSVFHGKSIVGLIPYYPDDDSNLANFYLSLTKGSYFSGDVHVSFSIVPVSKSGTEADTLNSILQALTQINQNLITSNTLQQQTIDAINQHDENEKSWFQQLIYNMGIGFSALYEQMTEEQDEQLTQSSEQHDELVNGYDATTGYNDNEELDTNLDQMEVVENTLTTDAFDGMNNYTITNDIMDYDAQFVTSFPIVAGMIQSVFDSSGEFGIIISVAFTVVIASMLIGLYRYFKD